MVPIRFLPVDTELCEHDLQEMREDDALLQTVYSQFGAAFVLF
jgi:hypothetical protein